MVSARKTLALCLNGSLLLQEPSSAFTGPTKTSSHPSLKRSRVGPLHSFEVMEAVGTTHAPIMSTVNSFFQTQPYLAAFLTCSFKASAADMIAQTQEMGNEKAPSSEVSSSGNNEANNNVNISRNLGFLFYGGIYQGMAQNFIFNVIYPSWFGTDESLALVGKEVLVDNLLFAPLLCLPIAYAFKTAFSSEEPLGLDTLKVGLENYVEDVTTKGLLARYWSIWFPANMITFGVIPPHYRVVFVASISFFWIFMLSTISSSSEEESTVKVEEVKAMPVLSMDQ
ncbi:unnamed protein product [Cylindrotheca closterium]|uniref:Protein Mpv17 n=1 Tax=Cylindrotheca closterium TaxID=2856 RepID=A0AAD2JHF6_9STRA|nr:unnamed protein product [Cylindrotheca closterium]